MASTGFSRVFSADNQQEDDVHSESTPTGFAPLIKTGSLGCARWAVALSFLALLTTGCGRVGEIRRYQIPKSEASEEPSPKADDAGFTFEAPETWKPGKRVVSRMGMTFVFDEAFEVTDGEQRVDITVNRMRGSGTLLMNVNRWRGQVELEEIESDQLDSSIEDIKIGGIAGKYAEIVGPTESIFGVIVVRGGTTWYLKLKGANELAEREKDNFRAFLESVKFK